MRFLAILLLFFSISTFAQISTSSSIPVGSMIPFVGTTAPTGFLLNSGSCIDSVKYKYLCQVLGTTYGTCPTGQCKLPQKMFPEYAYGTSQAPGTAVWGYVYNAGITLSTLNNLITLSSVGSILRITAKTQVVLDFQVSGNAGGSVEFQFQLNGTTIQTQRTSSGNPNSLNEGALSVILQKDQYIQVYSYYYSSSANCYYTIVATPTDSSLSQNMLIKY